MLYALFSVVILLYFLVQGFVISAGKLKPNPYVGMRTPAILSDEKIWDYIHRYYVWVYYLGALSCALALALVGMHSYGIEQLALMPFNTLKLAYTLVPLALIVFVFVNLRADARARKMITVQSK